MGASETRAEAPGARILGLWRRLAPLPGGRWLFHRALYRVVPYSGTTGAEVVSLEPGRVEMRMADRRRVRNHLRSVHAVALANVGELASGLAMLTALPPRVRGIVVHLEIDFLKKARGELTVRSAPEVPDMPDSDQPLEYDVTAEIRDEVGDVVARTTVSWRLEAREGS